MTPEARPIEIVNVRADPLRVLTFSDWERRTPGPSLLIQPGDRATVRLHIAGFRLEPNIPARV